MAPTTQSITELFDTAHREACAAFERHDVDISVVRDSEEPEDRRYIARAILNSTLAIAHEATPEEALERLIRLIIATGSRQKAIVAEVMADTEAARERTAQRSRDIRATMPTLAPIEGAK